MLLGLQMFSNGVTKIYLSSESGSTGKTVPNLKKIDDVAISDLAIFQIIQNG